MTDASPRHVRALPSGPVIFDCDGTLIDTEHIWDAAYNTLFDRYHATLNRAHRHRLVGLTLTNLGHELGRLLHQPHRHQELATEVLGLVTTDLGRGVPPMPGAVDIVTTLTRPIGVASNTVHDTVVKYLTTIGIIDLVDVVIGSDDVPAPKPAPDVYLAACRRLNADPATAIAVEDSAAGTLAARTAGLYVIGVPSQPDLLLPAAHTVYPSLNDPRLRHLLQRPIT